MPLILAEGRRLERALTRNAAQARKPGWKSPGSGCVRAIEGDRIMRTFLIALVTLLTLSACGAKWEPPQGTGYRDRWADSDRGR